MVFEMASPRFCFGSHRKFFQKGSAVSWTARAPGLYSSRAAGVVPGI